MYQSIGMVCDPRQGVYQLDASNDLPKTQKKFKNYFKSTLKLKGETAKPFNLATLFKAFEYCHVFIYAGHNNGLQYYRFGDIIKMMKFGPKLLTLAWLLGCSSVKVDVPNLEAQCFGGNGVGKGAGADGETPLIMATSRNNTIRTTLSHIFPNQSNPTLPHSPTDVTTQFSNNNHIFEPNGSILAYVYAGVPCIVGNLWNVLDQDVDKLTKIICEQMYAEKYQQGNEGKEGVCQDPEKGSGSTQSTPLILSQATLGKIAPCCHQYNRGDGTQWRFAACGGDEVGKGQGQDRGAQPPVPTQPPPLIHACDVTSLIATSRQGCVLPYLNGAAVVVYGTHVRTDKPTKSSKR